MQNIINLKTPISNFNNFEELDKSATTESRDYHRNKISLYNYNEIDSLNLFSDSNPVKVVVRFRPMNIVENVTFYILFLINTLL